MVERATAMGDVRSEEMLLNMGPQHPSTHGVMRVVVRTDGEIILDCEPHVGYLHRCYEKIAENLTYVQVHPYTDRMDYLAAMHMNWGYALTVEKLMGLEVPRRAEFIRIIVGELQRIASHLMAIGTYGLDLGGFTPFLYCFRDREHILKLFERICGQRLNYTYIRIGGVSEDIDETLVRDILDFVDYFEPKILEVEDLLTYNGIFINRTANVGILSAELAIAYGVTGPNLRGAGVKKDLRKDLPYSVYDELEFDVPVGKGEIGTIGDCWNRYHVRALEILESCKLIRQACKMLPEGPHADEKALSRARPPKGEVIGKIEAARGELHHYLVSDGKNNPYRLKSRSPCFCNLAVLPELARGVMLADLVAIIGSIDIVMGEVDR